MENSCISPDLVDRHCVGIKILNKRSVPEKVNMMELKNGESGSFQKKADAVCVDITNKQQ
jgi:hypothetical protein